MSTDLPDTRSTAVLRRIRVFGALAAVCVLLLLALIAYGDYHSRLYAAIARTASQARTLAGHAARTFDVIDVTLAQLSDQLTERWRAGERPGARQRRLLAHSVTAARFVRAIAMVSPEGVIVISSSTDPPPDPHPAGRDYLGAAMADGWGRLYVGSSFADPARPGRWLIPTSRRVIDPLGRPAGAIVAYVDSSFFESFYNSAAQGGAVDAALIADSGAILAASNGMAQRGGDQIGIAPSALLPTDAVDEPVSATFPGDRFGGSPQAVVGLARVEGWPLWTMAVFDRQALTSDWLVHVVLLSTIGLVVILAAQQFIRVITGNLRRLDATEAELRRQVEDLEVSRSQLERQSAEMAGLAEQIARARDDAEQARRAADLANQAKSDFLARMSHELRTPLNAILGFSEIMKDRVPGLDTIDTYAQYAGDIHDSGSHLLSVINDILDLSKIEAGRFELGDDAVELRRAAIATTRLVREAAVRRGVTLDVDIADDLPPILSDLRVVKQMLLNLLSNALKFTPQGGTVTITAARHEGGVAVTVRDTGMGIDRKDFAKILEPFGQVKGAGRDAVQGTGLGLPLVKSFIELHGGRFDLQSEIGRGTVVTLWFPPERTAAAAPLEDVRQRCAAG